MKLSRTSAYAIHAIVYIAEQDDGRPVIGRKTARRLGMPEGFLLRLLVALARSRLLRSIKGPNGGYNLGRSAKTVTLLDIIEGVEGPVTGRADPTSNPPDAVDKKLQAVAAAATEIVRKEFGRVTLAELVGARKKGR